MSSRFIRILVLFGFILLASVLIFAGDDAPASTLFVTNYNGGEIEWVSIQGDNSPESKLADTGSNIVYGNKSVSIPLKDIKTGAPFDGSGKFIVVLKHKDSPRWMYIKSGVQFINGGASVKWGAWFAWRD
ncbi:hypothetical protein AGMMS49991_04050 [Spirochaetia bacterium]|nr:hypothetical protein AGMMS49991_04050 [Spirochaetia bacterium]